MILQALDRYYERMAARGEAPVLGYVSQSIRGEIILSRDGQVNAIGHIGDERRGRRLFVPAPITEPSARTATAIVPYFLADNPSYILGCRPGDTRTQLKFEKSANLHRDILEESTDAGLQAVLNFFDRHMSASSRLWQLSDYIAAYVFRLDGELEWAHQKHEAVQRWAAYLASVKRPSSTCLVSGEDRPIVRLHPKISGFKDADTFVGFDAPSFCSYGQEQGGNATTSVQAAHHYGAALNAMLASGERNRLRRGIGDASVVFWADASGAEAAAAAAEDLFAQILAPPDGDGDDDGGQAAKLSDTLRPLAEGRPASVAPELSPGVRFHVLGLSPNAARLSVRFWLSDSFDAFARHLLAYTEDIRIEPPPRGWSGKKGPPEIWRMLVKTTALQEKFENVPPMLAGELARAILGGQPFPRTWLLACITRLRAGDDPAAGWHAAALKACLNRNKREKDLPVALEPDNPHPAYQLGRLFAAIEQAQYLALGRLNATVADRFYGAASSTPARVFPSLLRNARNHVSDVKRRGGGGWLERKLDEIIGHLGGDLPRTLRLEDQGRFAVGYYHERAFRPAKPAPGEEPADTGALP